MMARWWLILAGGMGATALRLPFTSQRAPLAATPAIFSASDSRPVVLFDGECNLCNAGVNLLLDTDRCSSDERGNLRVAALQSNVGKILMARLPDDLRERSVDAVTGEYSSIVVAGASRAWVGSSAVLKIGRQLKGPLRLLALCGSCVPRFVTDFFYGVISKRRKSWFGSADQCRLWDDNWDTRFVSDETIGLDAYATDDDPLPDAPVPGRGDAVVVSAKEPVFVDGLIFNGLKGTVQAASAETVTVKFDQPDIVADLDPGALKKAAV